MKFIFSDEWLDRKLKQCDDINVAVSGPTLEEFNKIVEQRTVTPQALDKVPTQLGKVVRFVREKRSWTVAEMAELADVDVSDIQAVETLPEYKLHPRTVIRLASVCQFSKDKFIEFAGHRIPANDDQLRYAARSKGTSTISDEEYEVVRALVETLSDQK
ncbi:helix-turn-helix domain-containing protein [Methylophilus flavus]|uniref:Helix-turn-helix domain-containing protein n=1 Tax=Methylophilus flavus TaxID=640084 RepID=A0ABW3PBQ1_9PROT